MKPIREKPHRLPEDYYKGVRMVAFTLCVRSRLTVLTRDDIYSHIEKILLATLKDFDCEAVVYLMMPDHCHLLLQGNRETSNVLKAVKMFKQKSGYWFARNHPSICWQKDFYDHIIRTEEDIRKQVLYILNNPVRKGIVEDWKKYRYKGSTIHNFNDW